MEDGVRGGLWNDERERGNAHSLSANVCQAFPPYFTCINSSNFSQQTCKSRYKYHHYPHFLAKEPGLTLRQPGQSLQALPPPFSLQVPTLL